LKKYGLYTAISLVVANMVGTGVFTSLGFQVVDLESWVTILFLWFLGGIAALLGALSYAELGVVFPRSGGEYNFLSRLYHPMLGFLAGWISFFVGFAAPIAAAAIAFGTYLATSLQLDKGSTTFLAVVVIIVFSLIHLQKRRLGAILQNFLTIAKIIIILGLIILGFIFGNGGDVDWTIPEDTFSEITSPSFAIAFYFVSYSYFGWNASAYIISELKNPGKNLPRSLFVGTAVVTLLYLLVNFIFMYTIPFHLIEGKIEVGYVFGEQLFNGASATIIGLVFSFLLLATISAMILTGPRVTQVIGKDYKYFAWFSSVNKNGIPSRALIIQGLIAVVYVLTSTFEQVITYIGFTLNVFTTLAVAGVFFSRRRYGKPKTYGTVGYPIAPAIFVLINIWILTYGLLYKPLESFTGIGITLAGAVFYFLVTKREKG